MAHNLFTLKVNKLTEGTALHPTLAAAELNILIAKQIAGLARLKQTATCLDILANYRKTSSESLQHSQDGIIVTQKWAALLVRYMQKGKTFIKEARICTFAHFNFSTTESGRISIQSTD